MSRPVVTLHLRSGREIYGRVIGREGRSSHHGAAVLLQPVDPSRGALDGVVFVGEQDVVAVTVHGATMVLDVLSDGDADAPPDPDDVLTKLEIRRRLEDEVQQLQKQVGTPIALSVAWEVMPESDLSRWCLWQQIQTVIAVLREIAYSGEGQDALRGIASLDVRHGNTKAVIRPRPDCLVIEADFEGGRTRRFGHKELVAAIEGLL